MLISEDLQVLFTSNLDWSFINKRENDWHRFGIDYVTSVCLGKWSVKTHILVRKIHASYETNSKWWQSITFFMRYLWLKFEVNNFCRSQNIGILRNLQFHTASRSWDVKNTYCLVNPRLRKVLTSAMMSS